MEALLRELYERTCCWQLARGVRVELTEAEFIGLWTKYRTDKFAKLIDRGEDSLRRYLKHPLLKPVCGWRSKEARTSGVMSVANVRIMGAEEQRRLFQFDRGDRHSPDTIQKMRKPKSDRAKDNMRDAARRRWAAYRADKEDKK